MLIPLEKWYKKVIEGEISPVDTAYTLKVTSNKREPVYVNGIFNATKPYNYNGAAVIRRCCCCVAAMQHYAAINK
jgi:hypothetical protein